METRIFPDHAHCLVTIHFRHHDIHQNQINFRMLVQFLQGLSTVFRFKDDDILFRKGAGQRIDIAHVVINYQDLFPFQHRFIVK